MIYGIGVDIVKIDRLKRGWERYGERFARRILGVDEYREFESRRYALPFLATRFAAKEAFAKALGTGFTQGLSFQHIRVDHDRFGRPILNCHGQAANLLQQFGIAHTHISISDEQDYAVAFVTLEI